MGSSLLKNLVGSGVDRPFFCYIAPENRFRENPKPLLVPGPDAGLPEAEPLVVLQAMLMLIPKVRSG
ncbi:MAG: hypothetical protein ACOCS6_00865 [Desulfosalsimonas sp.]